MRAETDLDSRGHRQLAASIALCVVAVALYMVEPLYLGALADSRGFSANQLGVIVTAEVGAMLLASLAAPLWLARLPVRPTAWTATVVVLVGNLAGTCTENLTMFVALRVLVGLFGAGPLFTLGIRLVGQAKNPERAFGLSVAAQVFAGALGLGLLPLLLPVMGAAAVLGWVALLAAISMGALRWLPRQLQPPTPEPVPVLADSAGTRVDRSGWLLAVLVAWYLGLGALWAFLERIGTAMPLSAAVVGQSLAIGMVVGLVGSAHAAWLGTRFGTRWQMPGMLALHALVFLALFQPLSAAGFMVAMAVFNYSWNFALPYLLGAIVRSDPSGAKTGLIPACQTLGNVFGPLTAGLLIVGDNYQPVLALTLASYAAMAILLAAAMFGRAGQVANAEAGPA